ncbi:uncharacterized protein LOC128548946 [Mercenaria mercenaria]|uniref:uncharacterized protein LOC128548946 n=1 Tax=Mercenaria mercenaria TaxID=6596 RepID=UPI00234FAEDE|nr:uncharacterized protein LOC128548946 [Mercenaria mercenaria]
MVIVTTTGYYLTVVGPYLSDGKNRDAKILNHILNGNMEDIKSYIRPDDIFVVDRGFRDSLQLLEDLGIQTEMPSFLRKGQSQFDTEIRWVVESANARIKRLKYFDRVLPNSQEYSALIRVRLQSRHISAEQYTLWIKFNPSEVIGWYCECRSGARVVGMSAHCAAVIWFLSYAKQRYVNGIGVRDWCEYLDDASVIPPTIDSSDSESD